VSSRWVNVPFSPRRVPVFYGWVMVAGSVMALLASIPGQTIGVGVFTDALIEAWGLTRIQLATAYMLGTIVSSFLLPFAGRFLDWAGARVMVVGASIGLGASLLLVSWADKLVPSMAVGSFVVAMAATMFCFLCLRFFGQGCLALVSRVVVGKWFHHRRGLATALVGFLAAFGFNGSPIFLNKLVEGVGWRPACWVLAAIVGLGVSAVGWLIYRDNPEQCGLRMDGGFEPAQEEPGQDLDEIHREFTRGEASRTWAFWVFSLAVGGYGLVLTAMSFHIASIGEEMGLSRDQAFAVFLPISFVSIWVTLAGGWACDRTKLKYILWAFLAGQVIGTAGLWGLGTWWGRAMVCVGYGIGGGLFLPLATVPWPRFFGREHLGAISGLNTSVMVFGSAIGPVLFSTAHQYSGSYRPIILASALAPVILFAAAMRADNPQERI
jgi:MFS transporter, OFA family, oxalate/formate antiporter